MKAATSVSLKKSATVSQMMRRMMRNAAPIANHRLFFEGFLRRVIKYRFIEFVSLYILYFIIGTIILRHGLRQPCDFLLQGVRRAEIFCNFAI